MKVDEVSINQVFLQNRSLRIPYFQRPYVWKEENWEKFFNDIADLASPEDEEANPEGYFMGSIILRKGKNRGRYEQFDVIDGQQRLTTIVLFMKALYLVLGHNEVFEREYFQQSLIGERISILVPNRNDKSCFNAIVEKDVASVSGLEECRMTAAFKYFIERLQKAETDTNDPYYQTTPMQMLDSIIAHVRLVCIEVAENENAQKIFETINCTGIKLTTGEMLKNYLFDESRVDAYENTWMNVFEKSHFSYWNDDIVLGRLKTNHIEHFFYRYMLIKMKDPEVRGKLDQKTQKKYRKQEALFPKFKQLIETCNLQIDNVIDEIVELASLYKDTFVKTVLSTTPEKNQGINRLVTLMYATDNWTMTPYVLYILKNVPSALERTKIFGYMENYLIRRIICKSANNNYSDMFSENLIGQDINTYDGFKAYVNDSAKRGALLMPTDEEVEFAIMNNDLRRDAKTLLFMLESKINESFGDNGEEAYSSYTYGLVRGIWDNASWPTADGFLPDESERLWKTLGNSILLKSALTSKARNSTFAVKSRAIAVNTESLRFGPELKNMVKWDELDVKRRNIWLADTINECWPA